MNYKINLGAWNSVFAVPSELVDNHLLLASGAAVKVLLLLLRNSDKDFTEQDIAKKLKISDETVTDSLIFWENAGLLCNSEGFLTPPKAETKGIELVAEKTKDTVSISSVRLVTEKTNSLSPSEIAKRIDKDDEIKFLFAQTEKYFGRPLNFTEQRGLISIHDFIGLPSDVVLILIKYCKSIDKCNMRYVETVAAAWADKEINSHLLAEDEIKKLKKQNKYCARIKAVFGIERNLNSKEKDYISKWLDTYKMSLEMIEAAFEIMCDKTGKISFAYIDKILQKWNEKGIHTVDDAQKEREEFRNKKSSSSKPSYNISEFEKMAIKITPKGSNK